jgi:photosystem II stability/assembly factor-like uncharacterized protein
MSVFVATRQELVHFVHHAGQWSLERPLPVPEPLCFAVDPLRPERAYCGTASNGLWRSDDAGRTWRAVGAGIAHPAVLSVAVSAVERAGEWGVVYAGTEPSALYRSEDGGETWLEGPGLQDLPSKPTWSYPPRPETHHVRQIGLDLHHPGKLFVCIENGALVVSTDSGATWTDRTPDSPMDTHTIATHKDAPGRVYCCAGDGFVRAGHGYGESRDGARSWTYPDEGLSAQYGWGLAVDPGDPDTVLVSMAHDPQRAHNPMAAESFVYRRAGNGPWTPVTDGLPDSQGTLAHVLATSAAEPGAFYAVSNRGLYRSSDAGQHFERVDVPWPEHLRFQHIQALTIMAD